jgi:hypothetical protein
MEDPDTTTGMLVRQIIRDAAPKEMNMVSAPSPDAELLEACAAFEELERAYIAVPGDYAPGSPEEEEADAERDRITAAQASLVDRICELRAVTREGLAARASSLALWDGELMKDRERDVGERLTAAIVRDLIG